MNAEDLIVEFSPPILANHNFFVQTRYRSWHCDTRNADGAVKPSAEWTVRPGHTWPPEPFAPLHYAGVKQASGNRHFVVMLADGRVLDPYRDGVYRLTDWAEVENVVGVIHPEW